MLVKREIGNELFERAVLVRQLAQAVQFGHAHPSEAFLLAGAGVLADAGLAAYLRYRHARFGLTQRIHDLLVGKGRLLHGLVLPELLTMLAYGLDQDRGSRSLQHYAISNVGLTDLRSTTMAYDPDSLLGRLQTLPDPRRRQGRRDPLPALLGLLILAALHGETSLRGMWLWSRQHWDALWWPLGFGSPHVPALTTIWNLLGTLDADAVDRIVRDWLSDLLRQPVGGVRAGGKVLRGSRRADVPGVWLVALARHDVGSVVRQRQVATGSHELPTLLALLRELPLDDQIVTLDAGVLCADTTQVVRAQQGDYLGVLKRNQADIKIAVDDWITEQVLFPSADSTCRSHRGEVTGAPGNP